MVGQEKKKDGSVKQKYVNAITLLKDVVFEETHDNAMNAEPEDEEESGTDNGGSQSGSQGSSQGGDQGGSQSGGGSTGGDGGDGGDDLDQG